MLCRQPDTEADEDGAGDEVEHAARARPAEEVADARDREHVDRQPRQADEAEEYAEQDERAEARLASGRELRQEAREEDGDLRVAEVRQQALAEGDPRRDRTTDDVAAVGGARLAERAANRLQAEPAEVDRAGDLERDERGLGRAQERRDADSRRERPDRQSEGDAEDGEEAGAAAADERVPRRDRRVRPGGDREQGRDGEKRTDVRDQALVP